MGRIQEVPTVLYATSDGAKFDTAEEAEAAELELALVEALRYKEVGEIAAWIRLYMRPKDRFCHENYKKELEFLGCPVNYFDSKE